MPARPASIRAPNYHYRARRDQPDRVDVGRRRPYEFTTFAFTRFLKDPCRTPMFASRSAPPSFRIAAPTSSSRRRTPAAMTSSRTRSRPGAIRRFPAMAWTGPSTESTRRDSRAWNPTNRGVDPYVATAEKDGWSTEYAGLPADDPFSTPRSPRPLRSRCRAEPFAFGGAESARPASPTGPRVSRCAASPVGWPGNGRPDPGPARTRTGRSASASRAMAATSSSARPRSSSRTETKTAATFRSTTGTSTTGRPRSSRRPGNPLACVEGPGLSLAGDSRDCRARCVHDGSGS